jgi:MFS family permease
LNVRQSLDVLGQREFRLLWLGRSLSSIGDALVPVATAFAVLEIGSASDLGIVLGTAMAARVVFMMAGGVWADRLPRRLIMIAADAVRAGVQLVIALAFLTDAIEVWHLVLSSAVFGVAASFFRPASTGLLPQIVPMARVQEANAVLGLSQNAIELFGPAVAGILIATAGYELIYAIDSATFAASLVCLALMRPLGTVRTRRAQSFLADAREGIREVMARPWIRVTITADVFTNFALAPYFVLGPLVVQQHLDGAPDWGLMMAASAAGGIAGGALTLRWKPKRPLIPAYVGLMAMPLALLSLVPPLPLPLLMLGSSLLTMSIVVGNTFWSSMEQQHVPDEVLGRVDSVAWTGSVLIMPIAYALAGPAAETIGVRAALVVAAAIGVACTGGALLSRSVRDLRRLDDEPTPPFSPETLDSEGELPAPVPTIPHP